MSRASRHDQSTLPSRVSRRAPIACQSCNLRKVRCTVSLSGPPCANCVVDGVTCEVTGRKRRRNPDLLEPTSSPSAQGVTHGSVESPDPDLESESRQNSEKLQDAKGKGDDRARSAPSHQHEDKNHEPTASGSRTTLPSARPAPYPRASETLPSVEDASAYAQTLESCESRDGRQIPFYPGDERGPAFVVDICKPKKSSGGNHVLVPTPLQNSLLQEDYDYASSKGSFNLPQSPLRQELIRCYFHHVHPLAPILDIDDFLTRHERGRASLLLLWSMFLASASFLSDESLPDGSRTSLKAFKRDMFRRAKALFDIEYEKDKITLIQSTFLLSHWFNDSEDRNGPWHWNGIALSLCHTIGLHRLSSTTTTRGSHVRPFWRLIWWTVYCREVWLSLGMGRPMRIASTDFDTDIPTDTDLDSINQHPIQEMRSSWRIYIPNELSLLTQVWLRQVRLTVTLSEVLSSNYTVKGPALTETRLLALEEKVRNSCAGISASPDDTSLVSSHIGHLQLYQEAVVIVLYRPYIRNPPANVPKSESDKWWPLAYRKARMAASQATSIVNDTLVRDLSRFCQTIYVIAMVPPMQIHLLESTSYELEIRTFGQHHLALCMLALDKLRNSYVSADATLKLFEAARARLKQQSRTEPASPSRHAGPDASTVSESPERSPDKLISLPADVDFEAYMQALPFDAFWDDSEVHDWFDCSL